MSDVDEMKIHRFERFAASVLKPAIYTEAQPLAAEAHVSRRAISIADARRRAFRDVKPGWRFGPKWATCWFRLSGRVPESLAAGEVALRFSSATEALLWQGGSPWRGLDRVRDSVRLYGSGLATASGGETIELWVEATCNPPLSTGPLERLAMSPGEEPSEMLSEEFRRRWESEEPGRFEFAELCRIHLEVQELESAFSFACGLVRELRVDSPRRVGLETALARSRELVSDGAVQESAAGALEPLRAALALAPPGSATFAHAIGHASDDKAGYWPLRETRRRCLRILSGALELIDRSKDFSFLCSQAVQWSFVEATAPQLFERMKRAALEERLEVEGGLWGEPDVSLSGGESLVRQILYARKYWMKHLGERGVSRCLFLPDAFGVPATLPQVMTLSGLDLFVTSESRESARRAFPHSSFVWEGLDGSEVMVHVMPNAERNRALVPKVWIRGEENFRPVPHVMPGRWLQLLGSEEGGPTEREVQQARFAKDCDGLPRVRLDSLRGFGDALREDRESCDRRGAGFPRWRGELGSEVNRGAVRTNGRFERSNRRCETDLRTAELLHYAAPQPPRAPAALRARFDQAWKSLLDLQSREASSGISIQEVQEEVQAAFDELRLEVGRLENEGLEAWRIAVDTNGLEEPLLVFNPAGGSPRSGVIDAPDALHGGAPIWVSAIPAHGISAVDASRSRPYSEPAPVRASGMRLENEHLEAELDDVGRLARLVHKASGRECGALVKGTTRVPPERAPLNQLVLHLDRSDDPGAEAIAPHSMPVASLAESVRVLENGPLRARIEVSRSIGRASRIVQVYTLAADSPRLDIETEVDWCEEHTLLRALFPVDVVSGSAHFDIQFGTVERSAQSFTSGAGASGEVCAHRFADISEHGFGVALLNDSRYGHSCRDGVLGLSLLQSPPWPGPRVGRGEHRFTYSLMPHAGDWREAGVVLQAEQLNAPLVVMHASPDTLPRPGAELSWAPFEIEVPDGSSSLPVVDAFKAAEEGDAVCLRIHEHGGGRGEVIVHWRLDVDAVEPVDLVEGPRSRDGFVHVGHKTRLTLAPFEIVTLRTSLRR